MSYEIRPMVVADASAAAELHIVGQPNTFLTSLGPTFLRVLYAEMASSEKCFGYLAVEGDDVLGVVTGTVDSNAIFKDLIMRRGFKLVLPVLSAIIRHPSLILRVFETLLYPSQAQMAPDEGEMLYLSSRADRRGIGIGHALYWAFVEGLKERGYHQMGLCVDATNQRAVDFHERQGMSLVREFPMYGRPFRWYNLSLVAGGDIDESKTTG